MNDGTTVIRVLPPPLPLYTKKIEASWRRSTRTAGDLVKWGTELPATATPNGRTRAA